MENWLVFAFFETGYSLEDISDCTGYSIKEIKAIIAEEERESTRPEWIARGPQLAESEEEQMLSQGEERHGTRWQLALHYLNIFRRR